MSKERGTSPEYPDVRYTLDRWVPNGLSQEHSEQVIERIAEDHRREDEALQGRKKPSLWKRFFGRRGD